MTAIATMTRAQAARLGFTVRRLSDRRFYVVEQPLGLELGLRRHGGYDTEQEALDDVAFRWLASYRAGQAAARARKVPGEL